MPPRKKTDNSQVPPQTSLIEPQPQVKNSDILDVDEASVLLKVSKKTIYSRVKAAPCRMPEWVASCSLAAKLSQWIALGGDLAGTIVGNEPSSLEQMLHNGQARIVPKR